GAAMSKIGGLVRLSWTSEDPTAGVATTYDIVNGLLGDLRTSGSFSAATCLAGNVADTPYDDATSPPPPGSGRYYLIRAQNACGAGTYGNSSLVPDPRDALDSGSTCP